MKAGRSLVWLMAVLLLLVGCSTLSETPAYTLDPQVTFGSPDGNAHPYVGALRFTFDGIYYYSCTGTLLSPTVMLTAGHCVEDAGETSIATYVSFDEKPEEPSATWIAAEKVIPHPGYDDFVGFPNTHDIGLVILSEAVELGEYATLPKLGFFDTLTRGPGRKDRGFTAVGYGMQGLIPPFRQHDFARYQASVSLIELRSAYTGEQGAKFSNNPGRGNGQGGTCFGDSGGPLFYGDSNVIGAIVSWGITPCIGVDYQFRLDTQVAQDFVKPYLP